MVFNSHDLQAIRECCRDDAAFATLEKILEKLLAEKAPSEEAVRRELRYAAILDAMPDRVCLVNRNGDILDCSFQQEDLEHGISPETIIGNNLKQFVPPNVAQICLEAIARTLDTNTLQTFEYQLPETLESSLSKLRDYELRLVVSGEDEVLVIERDITERKQTEQRLHQAESQYRSIFESISDGLVINDLETGVVIEANPACCQMHGYTYEEFIGLTPKTFIHPDSYFLFEQYLAAVNTGKPFRRRAVDCRKDGTPFDVEVRGTSFDYQGKPHLLGVLRDISEQVRAETALRESEARNRALVDAIPDSMFRLDETGICLDVKAARDGELIMPPSQLIGKSLQSVLPPEVGQQWLSSIQQALQTGEIQSFEYQILIKGTVRDREARIVVSGAHEVVAIMRDITDRKRSEEALRESEEKFSKAFRCSPAAITLTTLEDGCLIDVNDSFLKNTGYQREEVIGRSMLDLNIWADLAARNRMLQTLQAEGVVRNQEFEFHRKSGELGVMLFSAELITFKGQSCILAVVSDITERQSALRERKQAQEALQRSEARNRAFLNAIPDMMFRISRGGTYLDFKADRESDFAIPPTQMVGRSVYEVLPVEVAAQRMEHVNQALQTAATQVYEYQLPKKGEMRDYEARIVVSGKDEVLAIMRDITERKRAEAQLRASADRDRLLGQIALRIRRSLNLDQILTTTVEEVKEFLKADRVFIGQIEANWQGRIIAEAAAPEWGSILTWIVDDLYLREIRALFEQGQIQVIDNTDEAELSPLMAEYYHRCQIRASLGVPIILNDDFFGVLVVNQCAHPRHWSPFEVDLLSQLATQVAIALQQAELYQQVQTSAANLERQVLERTAQLEQKMQELQELNQIKDDFLHAVSHDLRTPVMGMSMVLKNLQNKAGDTITISRSVLDRMAQSCDRQLAMINSLLEAHSSEIGGIDVHSERVSMATLVQIIVEDLDPWVTVNQATLTSEVPPDLPPVMADSGLIRRVFENLLTNALRHNPPGLHLTIQAAIEDEMMRCYVQDDGVGMTQIEQDSLFERYTRGPRARRSTGIGLGLYLCRQIITAHGGQIGATSTPGAGAIFWFTLPLASA